MSNNNMQFTPVVKGFRGFVDNEMYRFMVNNNGEWPTHIHLGHEEIARMTDEWKASASGVHNHLPSENTYNGMTLVRVPLAQHFHLSRHGGMLGSPTQA